MKAVELLRQRGCGRIALAGSKAVDPAAWGADGQLDDSLVGDYDGVVIVEVFPEFMRKLAPMHRRGATIIPAAADMIVSPELRTADAVSAAWHYSNAANYVARCGLRGHYLEFGTFWGNSFYNNYYQLRQWLQGQFYAFDSFQGLSAPLDNETRFTAGDFQIGEYFCNLASFQAIGTLLGVDESRISAVPGFFSETLRGGGMSLGLAKRSVSVCVIDCDLREALAFVGPLLEDGAFIYFDDWRLCRGSAQVGERAAALAWLAANPEFELIELPALGGIAAWQSQWFICQRR